jgi:hypothetical protein
MASFDADKSSTAAMFESVSGGAIVDEGGLLAVRRDVSFHH